VVLCFGVQPVLLPEVLFGSAVALEKPGQQDLILLWISPLRRLLKLGFGLFAKPPVRSQSRLCHKSVHGKGWLKCGHRCVLFVRIALISMVCSVFMGTCL
jgi:hypothetical protein